MTTETETTTKTEIDSGTFALEAPTLPALREALARTGAKPEHVRRILLAWMGRAPLGGRCEVPLPGRARAGVARGAVGLGVDRAG